MFLRVCETSSRHLAIRDANNGVGRNSPYDRRVRLISASVDGSSIVMLHWLHKLLRGRSFETTNGKSALTFCGRDPKLNSEVNGFILAMALWHLGQKEQAHETLDKTSGWMAANMDLLETRRKAKPLVEQPNSETLARLKQEAEQLIKINGTP
jgi:hypothetical protein